MKGKQFQNLNRKKEINPNIEKNFDLNNEDIGATKKTIEDLEKAN